MPRGKTLLLAGGASISNATFTGQSLFADGTATLPSISFTNQTNTGIFRNAASDMRITVNGGGVIGFTATDMIPVFDNSLSFGDATHRATNIQTKTLTIGQSIANPVMGVVTLSGGTGTASVQTTALAASARIFLTHQNAAGTTGTARVTSSTNGVGFTIVSSSSTDTSTIGWFIFLAS